VASTGTYLIAIPLSLFLAIMLAGKISGGHHNPAVTMAFLVAAGNLKSFLWFIFYVIA